jgi:hypothetical protein
MKDLVLQRLELALTLSCDPRQRALIDCERAYHFARAGEFLVSRDIAVAIRQSSQYLSSPSVAIWIMIVDGINDFFQDLSPLAQDRFRRAQALSKSIDDTNLLALSSAWLAHAEFERCNYPAALAAIARCIPVEPRWTSSTVSRIYMVLANINFYCSNTTEANEFYELTRATAVEQGDRATLGAIVYNRSALMLNSSRLQNIIHPGTNLDIGVLSAAIESATSFQRLTQNRSLEELPAISEARLAMIRRDFSCALPIVQSIRDSGHSHRSGVKTPLLDIEYAKCLAMVGQIEHAKEVFTQISIECCPDLQADDRVLALSLYLDLQGILYPGSAQVDITELVEAAKCAYSDEINELQRSMLELNRLALAQISDHQARLNQSP